MATQSASGNRYSASTLKKMISECKKILELYLEAAEKIQIEKDCFWYDKVSGVESESNQLQSDGTWTFFVDGIEYDRDMIGTKLGGIDTFISKINLVIDRLDDLSIYSDKLNNLADEIEKYQKKINKVLESKSIKSKAVFAMAKAGFASNKGDAKSNDFIPKNKVSTDPEDWEGDLKFERQDNGTYLVIKVGKDGSEVPMGYTTRKGKNAYYNKAKDEVLKKLKEKTTSSKENNASSKENNTSDSNEVASNSIDGISEDEVSKNLKSTIKNSISLSSWHKLTESEKKSVSKLFIEDLKKQGITKKKLEGCKYSYWTERIINNGKLQKVVHIDATKRVVKDAAHYETIRVGDGKYTFDDKG